MRKRRFLPVLVSVLACSLSAPSAAPAAEGAGGVISSSVPADGATVVGKKPLIAVTLAASVSRERLVVLLDGTDVTQNLTFADLVFTYRPLLALEPGAHELAVTVQREDGTLAEAKIAFTSRHTAALERAEAGLDAALVYEQELSDHPEGSTSVRATAEGNLQPVLRATRGAWDISVNGNLRYTDQWYKEGVVEPDPDPYAPAPGRLNLIDYVGSLRYEERETLFSVDLGQVSPAETRNTVSGLTRRGGLLSLRHGGLSLRAFDVVNKEVWSFGEAGFGTDAPDHLYGVSGALRLPGDRVELKAVWARGGEPEATYGTSALPGGKEGDVVGVALLAELLPGKLRTELEYDRSTYDPDVGDDVGPAEDAAWRVGLGGAWGVLGYQAAYERVGRDYQSIASSAVQPDRQGASGSLTAAGPKQALTLLCSRYRTNVEDDPLLPVADAFEAGADYRLDAFASLPLRLGYRKSLVEAGAVPGVEGSTDARTESDSFTGSLTYLRGGLSLALAGSHIQSAVEGTAGQDTRVTVLSLTPSYSAGAASLSLSAGVTRTENLDTDVTRDDYLGNATVNTRFLRDRLSLDLGGSYTLSTADDNSVDQSVLAGSCRLGWNWKFPGFEPTVALRADYSQADDRLSDTDQDPVYALFIALSAAVSITY